MDERQNTQNERDHARWRSEHGHWRKDIHIWTSQHEHLQRILDEVAQLIHEFDSVSKSQQQEITQHEDQMLVHDAKRAPNTARLYRRWCEACLHVHEAESEAHVIAKLEHCAMQRLHRGIITKIEAARQVLTG